MPLTDMNGDIPSEQDIREEMGRDESIKCSECGLVSAHDVDALSGDEWAYVELNPHEGRWGWLCPQCQSG